MALTRFYFPVIISIFLSFSLPAKSEVVLDSKLPNYYQADPDEKVKSKKLTKEEIVNKRSKIMQSMSSKTKNLMEFERKAHVKAFRRAFDTLTPEEKKIYKKIRTKLRDNSQNQKKFFATLNSTEKNFLRAPRKRSDFSFTPPDGVRIENVKKFEKFEAERDKLTKKLPEKIMNVEISDDDKFAIHAMRQKVEAEYNKTSNIAYGDNQAERDKRVNSAYFTKVVTKNSDRMR